MEPNSSLLLDFTKSAQGSWKLEVKDGIGAQGGVAGSEGEPSVANINNIKLKKKWNDVMVSSSLKDLISGRRIDDGDLKMQHVQIHRAYVELLAEAERLRAENDKLRFSLKGDFSTLSYSILKWDIEQLRFLTGFPPVVFDWLVPQISQNVIRVHPEVKPEDHLLIVLMKLKLGLCDGDLGYRFQIDGEIITAICQTWIPALSAVLSPLIEWQSGDVIYKTKPQLFRSKYPKCCCILDCVDFIVLTAKDSKRHVRYFVGMTPSGAITFLPPGFSRNMSEKRVLSESGFFGFLKASNQILASKPFSIVGELTKIGVNMYTQHKGDRSEQQLWSHVEKVLTWWKDFGIFQTDIPAAYEEMVDDVVITCAALTNLKISLVPNVLKT